MFKDQVLVVDDEKDIGFLLSKMLKKMGYEVSCAYSMLEGRRLLREKTYKLIFLDLSLPDGFGFNLIPYIKRTNTDGKVVMITAFEGSIERERAKIEGAHYFIPKPFNAKSVRQLLKELEQPEAEVT